MKNQEIPTEIYREELVKRFFEKAWKEYPEIEKKNPLAEQLIIDLGKQTGERTFVRAYDKYIDKKETDWDLSNESLNDMSTYLNYKSFRTFCDDYTLKNQNMKSKNGDSTKGSNSISKNFWKKKVLPAFGVGVATIGSFLIVDNINGNSKQTSCMFWKEVEYKAARCDTIIDPHYTLEPFDEVKFRYFKQITRLDTIEPHHINDLWYDKFNNQIYIFTTDGINPHSGKALKPLTQYIFEKYITNH